MKLVFVSNILNHHQYSLCTALQRYFEDFKFVSTERTVGIGYQAALDEAFVLHYENPENRREIEELLIKADVVIFGACPDNLIKLRMDENKLSFLYSERFFKKGCWRRFIPKVHKAVSNRITQYKNKNIYVLCASAFLAYDLSLMGFPADKCFKWGYFPKVKRYDAIEKIINSKKEHNVLWAGRLLDWKHPDTAVRIAKRLKQNGYDFKLNIIGAGDMEQKLNKMISDYNLENEVHMLGSMKPEQVREYMDQAQIYLFTSDRYEGWGAVLNESMNSGCVVVASHEIGSVPFLLKDGKNGLIYKDGDEEDLYRKVKFLLDKPNLCRKYGKQAYLTLTDEWNAETAAERFIELAKKILNGYKTPDLFNDGPCSKANIIKDDWYK